ncbi:MAG: hypothetical protein O3B09_00245 [Proteobacteria bacterium]|nr:hypothetical protein [Pseudomonadota bacterium]
MSDEQRLLKEAEIEARKDKIKQLWQQYKKPVIAAVSVTLIAIISLTSLAIYKKEKQKKYSSLIQQAFIYEQRGNVQLAQEEFKKLAEDSATPKAIKALASLRYAAALLKNDELDKAVEIYLQINQGKDYDPFIKEFAGLSALKALVDSDSKAYNERIVDLIAKLEKNSKLLLYFISEQKAIFEWSNNNFKIAHEIFESLANNPDVPEQIKQRAVQMNEIYASKNIE